MNRGLGFQPSPAIEAGGQATSMEAVLGVAWTSIPLAGISSSESQEERGVSVDVVVLGEASEEG